MSPTKQPTILETIYAQRAKDVEAAKSTPGTTPQDLTTLLSLHLAPPLIPLVHQIKRASPSKGPIALFANAAHQALTYALSGASVISVLTEPTWFKGSLLDMRLARQAVDALPDRPAILRKEFILDEYQIAEARLWGADTVLLIVAMLSSDRLKELYQYSLTLGMEPLVEVNNAREMQLAIELGAKVIGVNNRNYTISTRLAELVRDQDVILCALSGISGTADVRTYKEQGVRAVLVGEALMRANDTGKFIRDLLDWPELKEANESKEKIWVKVTGVRTVDEVHVQALTAAAPRPLIVGAFSSEHHTLRDIQHAVAIAQLDAVQVNEGTPAGWIPNTCAGNSANRSKYSEPGHIIGTDLARPGLHQFALLDLVGEDPEWSIAKTVVEVEEAPGWVMPAILHSQGRHAVKPWAVDIDINVAGGDTLRVSKREHIQS
ncbi:indole-3-glycerol phosphate synthase-domain-containing protein [Cyathus striatus]|nr:indole-3-glycerol phosphate synthase-domain-containing protein [Cyathus striatus]